MRYTTTFPLAFLAASLLLAGCAADSPRRYPIGQKSESYCYVAVDSAQCRQAHDLSGGYPITRGGRD
ncbi:MAG: hypothetical protein MI920_15925 [Kiloniellales bacterium]|nr:hypothetical protein [Kiloniellales bacterium]